MSDMKALAKELNRLAFEHSELARDKNLHGFEALVEASVSKALSEVAKAIHLIPQASDAGKSGEGKS